MEENDKINVEVCVFVCVGGGGAGLICRGIVFWPGRSTHTRTFEKVQ